MKYACQKKQVLFEKNIRVLEAALRPADKPANENEM